MFSSVHFGVSVPPQLSSDAVVDQAIVHAFNAAENLSAATPDKDGIGEMRRLCENPKVTSVGRIGLEARAQGFHIRPQGFNMLRRRFSRQIVESKFVNI